MFMQNSIYTDTTRATLVIGGIGSGRTRTCIEQAIQLAKDTSGPVLIQFVAVDDHHSALALLIKQAAERQGVGPHRITMCVYRYYVEPEPIEGALNIFIVGGVRSCSHGIDIGVVQDAEDMLPVRIKPFKEVLGRGDVRVIVDCVYPTHWRRDLFGGSLEIPEFLERQKEVFGDVILTKPSDSGINLVHFSTGNLTKEYVFISKE